MVPNSNWLLFYKTAGNLPSEFAEVVAYDKFLVRRSGRVKTWGEAQERTCASPADAIARFKQERNAACAAGYELAREWRFDPAEFNFSQLAEEIKLASREAFNFVRMAHPGEQINAYAVVMDDSVMTIGPAANSVEKLDAAENNPDVLWNSAEWSHGEGGECFDIAYRMLLTQRQGPWPKLPSPDFKSGVVEAAIRALESLDREKFFGTGPDREHSVVLVQLADSEYLDDAIRRLNPPAAYARFKEWWASWN